MKHLSMLVLAVALAGCATQETQVAKADCKVAPVTTRSAVNKAGPASELERRHAQAQLRSTDYYRNQLAHNDTSAVVEALRDCP